MKNRVWCNEIPMYLGKEVCGIFLLEKIAYSENQSTKWQALRLADKSGYVNAKTWAEFINPEYTKMEGCVVKVIGKVEVFRDNYEIRVVKMELVPKEEYDSRDFYTKISQEERSKLLQKLNNFIDSVKTPSYKALLSSIYTAYRLKQVSQLPAITKYHHNYGGGWLVHTLEVTELALVSMDLFCVSPISKTTINRDLLITGALLHDIGIATFYEEGSELRAPRVSNRGKKVGYVADGLIYISCVNNTLKQKVEDLTELLHLISACHDKEIGLTKEAMILYYSNEMSKMYSAFDDAFYYSETKTFKSTESVFSKFFERTIERKQGGE